MYTQQEATQEATRLNNDVDGNPRHYVPAYIFRNAQGDFVRPEHCRKYTGKRYGAGWVFSSYSLENDLRDALESVV